MNPVEVAGQTGATSLSAGEQAGLLSAILARSPTGIAFLDPGRVVRAASASFARHLGLPLDRVVGRPFEELLPDLKRTAGEMGRRAREDDRAGEGPGSLDVSPVPSGTGALLGYLVSLGAGGSLEDAGGRGRTERFREDFLNLAAHELRTPLTTLKGYAQVLSRRGGRDEEETRLLQTLGAQSDRVSSLVQALVDVSQIQSGGLVLRQSYLLIGPLVSRAVQTIQRVSPRHRLSARCSTEARVRADRERLTEVLFNLLDNAVKYSPQGGPIDVTVDGRGGEVVVCVRDEGIGIPKEKQAQLFEAFYQVAPMVRPTTGMGLGLYLSREIIHRHGGRIWLESDVGKGSQFCFALPVA